MTSLWTSNQDTCVNPVLARLIEIDVMLHNRQTGGTQVRLHTTGSIGIEQHALSGKRARHRGVGKIAADIEAVCGRGSASTKQDETGENNFGNHGINLTCSRPSKIALTKGCSSGIV